MINTVHKDPQENTVHCLQDEILDQVERKNSKSRCKVRASHSRQLEQAD